LGTTVLSAFHHGMIMIGSATLDGPTAVALVQVTGWKVLAGLSLFICSLAGVVLAISAVQARGILTTKTLEPKWERINPLPNAQRMLGVQPWSELVKSLMKLLIVGLAVYAALNAAWDEAILLAQQAPFAIMALIRRFSVKILVTAGLSYLVLAALDYAFQLWQHEKNLRMTKEEVKLEHKQNEGDPL